MTHLVITVGTSLFHSASWRNDGPFTTILGYAQWLQTDRLQSPQKRRSSTDAGVIEDAIAKLLQADPPGALASFDLDFTTEGRYSAELTTLQAMRRTLDSRKTMAAFLDSYDQISMLHGSTADDPSSVAGRHLAAVITQLCTMASVRSERIQGRSIADQMHWITEYLKSIHTPADLLATGGYKAFTVTMSHAYLRRADEGWRLFYLHERDIGGELISEHLVGTASTVSHAPLDVPPHL